MCKEIINQITSACLTCIQNNDRKLPNAVRKEVVPNKYTQSKVNFNQGNVLRETMDNVTVIWFSNHITLLILNETTRCVTFNEWTQGINYYIKQEY